MSVGRPFETAAAIDVHAHCVPLGVVETLRRDAGRYGIEVVEHEGKRHAVVDGRVRTGVLRDDLVDVEQRVAAMDRAGIDVQVLSSWIDMTAYALPAEVGARYARMFNEALAATAAQVPGRFEALATVPLQDPHRAAQELRHAVASLGMVGVELATTVDGRELDDLALEPFWEAAEELRCLVLLHPYASLSGRGVSRYFLGNLVGNPAESTIAVAHLIFGGVLERHPALRFCLVHGGGFAPYQLGRWDHGYARNARGAAVHLTRSPSEWLAEIHHDTVVHSPAALRFLLDVVGPERVVLGSDHPFEMGDQDPLGLLRSVPGIDEQTVAAVSAGNLKRLLSQLTA
ncbi:amidohydrolase family protein [Nocardioides caldifontis]|uniref:amidohydrolase family protein n=1 Tax=Nocardioides caldifontis TaxID=2588938 RepID=UPI0013969EB8|nr:amidohydrolase family protein [Nocardioides caldifontis]